MADNAESVVSRLLAYAARQPEAPAIIDERGTLSYLEFSRSVVAAAGRLHQLGVRTGDTVAVTLGAGSDAALLGSILYGAGYLGAAVLPLYPDFPPMRRDWLAQRFAAKWLVGS
jgi:non-ribosomal peptide synthetase component F